MQWHQVLGFMAAVTPLALIPGTSFALVSQKVASGSRHDGVLVAFGTVCGLLVHAAFAALGLSALVMASAKALTAVKIVGACYLVWLGAVTWRSARADAASPRRRGRLSPWAHLGGFGQGLWSNVLNPKAASVYLTLLPQFLTSDDAVAPQIAVLAVAHCAVVLLWLLLLTSIMEATRSVFELPRFRSGIARLTGAVLVLLGVRTAVT
ncbi:LysE family translocator [Streptomyces sp. NPDC059447]|uniref:LysE family translocator n=1 Tax=Streptomyces sp. NPDC059447 TaxID=3346834 RepID=UPI0036AE0943